MKKEAFHGNLINEIGKKHNRLTVLSLYGRNKSGNVIWKCLCDCGNIVNVGSGNLKNGKTKSCGCYFLEKVSTHGLTIGGRTREYRIWSGIKGRCNNPKNDRWHDYGGRGIKIYDEWANSYEEFLKYMGKCPSKSHSIDRYPNLNGNYEPGNVRWATQKEQCNNKRNNVIIEYNGESKNIAEWVDIFGIDRSTFYDRVKRGWKPEDAISRPVNTKFRRKHEKN